MTEVTFGGKWSWNGALLPPGCDDPDQQRNFMVFADSMEDALQKVVGDEAFIRNLFADLTDGFELVFLSRGPPSGDYEDLAGMVGLVTIGDATKH